LEQKAQRIARNVLVRPDIQEALQQLLATKLYASEEDVIARSLKGLQVAVAAHS
jgi:sulfur transfer complex TusBCD TusB component (DsrH family)